MAATRQAHPFSGARKMKPTLKHRPAIWECMLGTVYAMNDAGDRRYFDYDWDAAREFAGVGEEGRDPRVYRAAHRTASTMWSGDGIRQGQKVLYVRRTA